MDVSVIIVNYNTARLIVDCVKSVRRHTTGIDYEIVVVDNCSHEDARRIISEGCGAAGITYVQLSGNLGFGRANNEGFKVARGRNLLCLNPDTVLLNNAIKTLSDYLDAHPDTGICGGNLYGCDMQPAHSYMMLLPGVVWELDALLLHKLQRAVYGRNCQFNHTQRPKRVAYITGADLMIRRSVAEAARGFSPEFFMYFEETDLCRRVAGMGLRLMNVPQARIQHLEGMSYAAEEYKVNELGIRHWEEGRLVYYRLHSRGATAWAAAQIYRAALAVGKLCFRLLRRPVWKNYECRQKTVRELRRGLAAAGATRSGNL